MAVEVEVQAEVATMAADDMVAAVALIKAAASMVVVRSGEKTMATGLKLSAQPPPAWRWCRRAVMSLACLG